MSLDLKYPRWQGPLAAAILEFDPEQLGGKLQTAQQAIASRLEELACGESNEHELRALFDGLSIIQGVKRDRLNFPARKVTDRS
jgi:hypothetical protein